jgi:DNA modification methylase
VKEEAGTGLLRSEQFALLLVFRSGKSSNRAQSNIEEGEQVRIKVGNHVETNVAPRARRKNRPRAPRGAATTVTMLEAVLKEGSNSGNIVLDSFLDSGTTLLAAERIGRVCRGMEMDAARVDLAVRRWQSLTGKSAIHGVSGTSFTELEMEARREF